MGGNSISMDDPKPLISIIVPSYNKDQYIAETLDSLLAQIYPYWECIVINDGSTDNTQEIIDEYVKKDNRIKSTTIPNSGVSKARNTGIRRAKAEFILPLDADDLLERTHLEKVMGVFIAKGSVRLVYTGVSLFGRENRPYDLAPFDYPTLLWNNMMHGTVYKKVDFERVGGYRENMVHGLEDWDLWIALMEDFTKEEVVKIEEPLFLYRAVAGARGGMLEKDQRLSKMADNLILNNFRIYQKYYPDIFNRVVRSDFDRNMLSKRPVKFLVSILVGLSSVRKRLFSGKTVKL
jgi:glycosyltransferase involved in cell wall biosynthesis